MDPAGNVPAGFSNFLQADSPESDRARVVAAPGVAIKSTTSYARDSTGYRVLSGTSQVCALSVIKLSKNDGTYNPDR
jgi:hypothetical protein